MVSVALALLAAFVNALSSVMQRRANVDEAEEAGTKGFGWRLLRELVTRRAWLLGAGAMIGSFLLQASALALGALAIVQPVLALELPLTVVLGAFVLHRHLRLRDWLATAGMAAGLAVMLLALSPGAEQTQAVGGWHEILAAAVVAALIGVLVGTAVLGPHRSRAALLGVATGVCFGLTAALMKAALATVSDRSWTAALTTWQTYGVAVGGLTAVAIFQGALHSGTLVAVQPGVTLADPLIAVLWATVVIGEPVRTGTALVFAALGAAVIVVGAVRLARSDNQEQPEREPEPARPT